LTTRWKTSKCCDYQSHAAIEATGSGVELSSAAACKLHLIFARTRDGVIGANNALPWHLPEDLAHFKRTTLGCPVIMGRKTWDSHSPKFRPLPGRTNVVVAHQSDWQGAASAAQAGTVLRAHSLEQALQLCGDAPDVWVIGGAQLWALALPLATSAVVAEIDLAVAGDAFAPSLQEQQLRIETASESHVAANGLRYRVLTLRRRPVWHRCTAIAKPPPDETRHLECQLPGRAPAPGAGLAGGQPGRCAGAAELKLTDDKFPFEALPSAGYTAHCFGRENLQRRGAAQRATPVTDVVRNVPALATSMARVTPARR